MIGTIFSAFRVPEIRKKLLFTALLLALYRLGAYIPVPGVSTEASSSSRRTTPAPTSWAC